MSNKFKRGPLGAFLEALEKEKIDCILIGMMAAVEQGAPMSTIDYGLWVDLPSRQYMKFVTIVRHLEGISRSPTLYELKDSTQVNIIFQPDGLQSFQTEFKRSRWRHLDGQRIKILPLRRVIASKMVSNREKDLAVLPVLRRTLRFKEKL